MLHLFGVYRAVIVEPEQSGNIGFIARLMENYGIDECALVNPQCSIDDTAEQYASHAQDTLHGMRQVDSLDLALQDLDAVIGTTGIPVDSDNVTRHGITPLQMQDCLDPTAATAIVLGREGTGLSNRELDRCDYTVRIPTTEDYPVMNLSHAAAVLFHMLHTAPGDTDGRDEEGVASKAARERLHHLFKAVAGSLDWSVERQEMAVRAFQNVLGRAVVTDRELQLLIGLFSDMETRCDQD